MLRVLDIEKNMDNHDWHLIIENFPNTNNKTLFLVSWLNNFAIKNYYYYYL
jgi:hypothetical protein